jgi:hypothetical protein
MGKVLTLVPIGIALLAACGDGDSRALPTTSISGIHDVKRESVAFGWLHPVTAKVFPDGAEKLGNAHSTISGNTLRGIVTDATVRVRGDDKACVTCHAWAKRESREEFCERVPAFLAQPTSKGDGHDPIEAKPLVLKDLLDRWHAAGCPE